MSSKLSSAALEALSPRRALFFEILQSGLSDRFASGSIPRIDQWLRYTTGELPAPQGNTEFHDPGEEYVEGLTASNWWDTNKFDWIAPLEETTPLIRAELDRVLAEQQLFKADSNFQQMMGTGWTAFRLQRMGEWSDENMAKFPITTKVIKSLDIPLAVRGVMFARQEPGSGVQAHSDGRNFILTCHLGVKIPVVAKNDRNDSDGSGACWIKVGAERRAWVNDKAMVFDTSFTHETGNDADEDRFVLIIDFWHPELSQDERSALEFIYDARNKFDSNRIGDIDASWVTEGKRPITAEKYAKEQSGNFFSFLGR
jgi:aspartate beta-hydroxylase